METIKEKKERLEKVPKKYTRTRKMTAEQKKQWLTTYNGAISSGANPGYAYARANDEINMGNLPKQKDLPMRLQPKAKKNMTTADAAGALSKVKKALISAEQTAKMAEQDLDDMRYTSKPTIDSIYEDAPKLVKATVAVNEAILSIQTAQNKIRVAQKMLRG